MSAKVADVVVIGAGPGGYVAAIRCAQLGMKVICIDRWLDEQGKPVQGGTCLNVGCIPSKALLDSTHHFASTAKQLAQHGVVVKEVGFDLDRMQQRKHSVVNQLRMGVGGLLKAAGVEVLAGSAQLLAGKKVHFTPHTGSASTIGANSIILAPGSLPIEIPAAVVNGQQIVDSSGALTFDSVPDRLGIIGAGVIGLELGSVWSRLGSEVVILEALDEFLPAVDLRIAREAKKILISQGLDIRLGSKVVASEVKEGRVSVSYSDAEGTHSELFDRLVVAVGRCPGLGDLLAEGCGVKAGKDGRIEVNDWCQTAVEGIYAIGDAVRGPMLAHKAAEEGVVAAERIAGKQPILDYRRIPSIIYTHPEIAWVGSTEQELKQEGIKTRCGEFPFAASGRALAAGETAGMVRLTGDADSDAILGCHIVGPAASDIIQQVVIAMEFEGAVEDLALTVFGHPTFSEALHEASLAVEGRAIHLPARPPRRRSGKD